MSLDKVSKIGAIAIVTLMALSGFLGITNALNPLSDKDKEYDPDMDGLNNVEEYAAGSDPNNYDTDADGLPDGWEWEMGLDPTDPKDAEMDNDFWDGEQYADYSAVPEDHYNNYDEYYRYYGDDPDTGKPLYRPTDPNNPDTDGDNLLDPDDTWPWDFGGKGGAGGGGGSDRMGDEGDMLPPEDFDGDGILDYEETLIGTDPWNPDTDGDGLIDPLELARDLDPNDWDTDNDGLIDGVETGSGDSTDGHLKDTDNDGLPDYWEDNDGDGILNGEEQDIALYWWVFCLPQDQGFGGFDPLITYRMKFRGASVLGMDPNTNDTDGDEISDDKEMQVYGPGPINKNSRSEYGYHQVNNATADDRWVPDRWNDEHSISDPSSGFSTWTENRFSHWEYWMTKAYEYGELPVNEYNVALYNPSIWLWWYQFGMPTATAEQWGQALHSSTQFSFAFGGSWKEPVSVDDVFGWMERGFAPTHPNNYRWNMYDTDPHTDDTDNDRMEDDWDPRPTIPDDRLDTAIALRRIGFPTGTGSLDWYWPEFGESFGQYPVSATLAPSFVWRDPSFNLMHDYFGFPYRIIDSSMNKGEEMYMEIIVGIERGYPGSEFFQEGWYQFLNVSIRYHNASIDVPADEWGEEPSTNVSYDLDDDVDGDGTPMFADASMANPWIYDPRATPKPNFAVGLDDLTNTSIPEHMKFESFDPYNYTIYAPSGDPLLTSEQYPWPEAELGPTEPYVDPETGLGRSGEKVPFINASQYPNPNAPLAVGTNWLMWSTMTFYKLGFYFMVPEGVMAGYVCIDFKVETDQNIHVDQSFDVFSGLLFGFPPGDPQGGWPYIAY